MIQAGIAATPRSTVVSGPVSHTRSVRNSLPDGVAQDHGDAPELGLRGRVAHGEEPALRELHLPAAGRLERDQRNAGLVQEGRHRAVDVLAGPLADREPQVTPLGIRPLVRLQVVEHSGAELVGPDPPFEHGEHRAALVVREVAGGLAQAGRPLDLAAHGARREPGVGGEGALDAEQRVSRPRDRPGGRRPSPCPPSRWRTTR